MTASLKVVLGGAMGVVIWFIMSGYVVVKFGGACWGERFLSEGHFLVSFIVLAGLLPSAVVGVIAVLFFNRFFRRVFFLLFAVSFAVFSSDIVLSRMNRPREFKIHISGTNGLRVKGTMIGDGSRVSVEGVVPCEFTCQAIVLDIAFAAIDPKRGDKMNVFINSGDKYVTGFEAEKDKSNSKFSYDYEAAVCFHLKAFGYSNNHGYINSEGSALMGKTYYDYINDDKIPSSH